MKKISLRDPFTVDGDEIREELGAALLGWLVRPLRERPIEELPVWIALGEWIDRELPSVPPIRITVVTSVGGSWVSIE